MAGSGYVALLAVSGSALALGMLAPAVAAASPGAAAIHSHVLEDRILDDHRQVTLVLERDGRCIGPAEIRIEQPFVMTAKTACVAEIAGPTDATPRVTVAGEVVTTALRTLPGPESPPPQAAGTGRRIALIPASRVPVGHDAMGAFLLVSNNGTPASDVELNITSDGAQPRALRWTQPGVARIDLVVPSWRPSIDVIVQHGSDPEIRARIAIDPGPPTNVVLALPEIGVGAPFVVEPHVSTTGGAPIPPARIRVDAVGCARRGPLEFACATAGPVEIRIAVEVDGAWVPIEVRSSTVAAAPRANHHPIAARYWQLAVRGGLASDRTWDGGAAAYLSQPISSALSGLVGIGWQYQRARFDGAAPVSGTLDFGEQQFELLAGVRAHAVLGLPWSLRAAVGPGLVRQNAFIDGVATSSMGLRATAIATGGVRSGDGDLAAGLDVGLRLSADVLAPAWQRPLAEIFMEVALVGRL